MDLSSAVAEISQFRGNKNLLLEDWINNASQEARKIIDKKKYVMTVQNVVVSTYKVRSKILKVYGLDSEGLDKLIETFKTLGFQISTNFRLKMEQAITDATYPMISGQSALNALPVLAFVGAKYYSNQLQKYGHDLIDTCNDIVRQLAFTAMKLKFNKNIKVIDTGFIWEHALGKWVNIKHTNIQNILQEGIRVHNYNEGSAAM